MTQNRTKKRMIFGISLAVASVLGGILLWMFLGKTEPPPKASPKEITLVQTISRVFGHQLDQVLDRFRRQHPRVTVSVHYGVTEAPETLRSKAVVLSGIDVLPDAAPLFYGDYIVLVYRRDLVKTKPTSWAQVVAEATRLQQSGLVRYGLSLPEEPYGMIPFLSRSLLEVGPTETAPLLEDSARMLIAGEIFAKGLSPKNCLTECVVDLMNRKQTAFAVVGEWRIPDLAQGLKDKLAVALMPTLPGGKAVSSPRRTYGLSIADDLDPTTRRAALQLRDFLRQEAATTIFYWTGKLPLDFDSSLKDEVDGLAQFQKRTVEVPIKKYLAVTGRLEPAWAALKDK